MTLAWIEHGRGRRRTGAQRALGGGATWLVSMLCSIACAENERPEPLSDVSGEDARRILGGSIRAPAVDAGAAPGGGGSTGVGSGGSGSSTGVSGGGVASSGTNSEETESGAVRMRQIYEGACEAPSVVQWGFFTYRALTPGDSSIAFAVRSAPSEGDLESAESIELLTASAALGTTRCSITGPAPCPLDLFVVLGGAPLVHHPIAELSVLLSPASADGTMPSVEQWQLNYSCSFNQ